MLTLHSHAALARATCLRKTRTPTSIETLEPRRLLAAVGVNWSSYLGGSDDDLGYAVAIDAGGNAWIAGYTTSTDLASGGFDTTYNGGGADAFVAKINANGTLAWCSYLGGSGDDRAYSIALDGNGNAWVIGETDSTDFASGGFDITYNDGGDAFIAKINANGSLAWTSYLGGSDYDAGHAIAIDGNGNAWVTGETASANLASGGFDLSFNGGIEDAFVAKINANGSLAWSSYLGGNDDDYGYGIAIDNGGNARVTGGTWSSGWASGGFDTSQNGAEDGFVSRINANGTLAWSTYLGGDDWEHGNAVAVDSSGYAWVTGQTVSAGWTSGGFDTSFGGEEDGFVVRISDTGALAWSSYLGGSSYDRSNAIAIDRHGNAWVAGDTSSPDLGAGGFDTTPNGDSDALVAKINFTGTLAWTSYLGGSGYDAGLGIAIDRTNSAWIVGESASAGWVSGGFDTSFNGTVDAFVTRLTADNSPPTNIALTSSSVAENQPVNTTVGFFSTTDPDPGETFTYTLVSGTGDADNGSFTISGNQLRTAASFNYEAKNSYSIRVQTTDSGGLSFQKAFTISVTNVREASVTSRQLFYNHSSFDGNNAAANVDDDNAIATDKQALLPGQTATFANYSSYSRGINGVMLDLAGFSGTLSTSDFLFTVGNSSTPASWSSAPTPTSLTQRALPGGITRITLIWADNAIQKQWLQVTLTASDHSDLAQDDVFYFGNATGETGNSPANAIVNSADEILTRNHLSGLATVPITSVYDFNRDGRVNTQDVLLARINKSGLTPLLLISTPASNAGSAPAGPWSQRRLLLAAWPEEEEWQRR